MNVPEPPPADIVYVASREFSQGDPEATLELRETSAGEQAVMVYSSLETLHAGAGPSQPWIAIPREQVPDLVRLSGAHGVLLDTVIPPDLRHGCEKDGDDA